MAIVVARTVGYVVQLPVRLRPRPDGRDPTEGHRVICYSSLCGVPAASSSRELGH